MLQDVVHPPDQLPIEGLSSPIEANVFDICDPNALFPDTLQNSTEVSSCSGCCYDDSYANDLPFSSSAFPSSTFPDRATTTISTVANSSLSALLDPAHPDPSADQVDASTSITSSFPVSPFLPAAQNDQFDLAALQIPLPDVVTVGNCYAPYSPDSIVSIGPQGGGVPPPPMGPIFEDGSCLSSIPSHSYVRVDVSSPPPSCSFLDHYPGMAAAYAMGGLSGGVFGEAPAIFPGGLMTDAGLNSQELEFQGENCGLYGPDSAYSSGDLPVLSETQQQMVKEGCGSPGLTSDMSTLEESTFKVGRLSVEERKEKIHRYMKKRNERNFSKKIKYACRKTLADSRPRVRGRFAKNDEFGETARPGSSNHEDEEEEDGGVKEEEDMLDDSDIFAHISGVNSFKCNYPIQSWM